MDTILLVVHLLIAVTLIVTILLQRSEGGALGIGGGGGGGGMMSGRAAGNLLSRVAAICGGLFFATSLGLTLIATYNTSPTDLLGGSENQVPAPFAAPEVPGSEVPAAPTAPEVPSAPVVPRG
ncbi:MAG: preprotein translocase subunit SecG [Parvibaculaceae bacterium]|jgi:preprotein translocase subunit SecG|nr:preprotein translocase subunit SecG [Parvibaculaceae bacterium]|tara:strand:- start:446 stop:814 length:369 start_codon:yes stop_codon:yes gene_type:complete